METEHVSNSPKNVLIINTLEWREYIYRVMDDIEQKNALGADYPTGQFRTAVRIFFKRLRPALEKSLQPKPFEELKKLAESSKYDDCLEALEKLEEWLYSKEVTKFDTRKKINTLRVENENIEKGL